MTTPSPVAIPSTPAPASAATSQPTATTALNSEAGAGAVVDGVDVDAVATAVQACPAVSGLYSGGLGEVGTYLPGRRVSGVQVGEDVVTVHVRTRWVTSVADAVSQIRTTLAGLTPHRIIDIHIDDIDDPPQMTLPAPAIAAPASASTLGSPTA